MIFRFNLNISRASFKNNKKARGKVLRRIVKEQKELDELSPVSRIKYTSYDRRRKKVIEEICNYNDRAIHQDHREYEKLSKTSMNMRITPRGLLMQSHGRSPIPPPNAFSSRNSFELNNFSMK